METETNIFKLAKILAEVHGHCYKPFYESYGETSEEFIYSWERLPENALDNNEVDQMFFIAMAKKVLGEIEEL